MLTVEFRIPRYFLSSLRILLSLGLVLYFLHNAFCLFYEFVPLGKMQLEAVMLVQKADDVLIKHKYCESYGNCAYKNLLFFDVNCNDIEINVYGSLKMNEEIKSEIIAEISRYSSYSIRISFYNETHDSAFFLISSPTTNVFINRRKS